MARGIYDNWYACWNGCPTYPRDIRICVISVRPDTDCIGLASYTTVANIDIVTARRDIRSGGATQGNIICAALVVEESIGTDSCIGVTYIVVECLKTSSRVESPNLISI